MYVWNMQQLHGTHYKPRGLNLACSPNTMRQSLGVEVREGQSQVVYLTKNTLICGAHGWKRSSYVLLILYFVFSCGRFWTLAFSLKRATLKEPPNAAERSVGVMREMAVSAARRCRLRDGQRCRLRHKHSCCSFNEPWLTTSRCIRGRNMMGQPKYLIDQMWR